MFFFVFSGKGKKKKRTWGNRQNRKKQKKTISMPAFGNPLRKPIRSLKKTSPRPGPFWKQMVPLKHGTGIRHPNPRRWGGVWTEVQPAKSPIGKILSPPSSPQQTREKGKGFREKRKKSIPWPSLRFFLKVRGPPTPGGNFFGRFEIFPPGPMGFFFFHEPHVQAMPGGMFLRRKFFVGFFFAGQKNLPPPPPPPGKSGGGGQKHQNKKKQKGGGGGGGGEFFFSPWRRCFFFPVPPVFFFFFPPCRQKHFVRLFFAKWPTGLSLAPEGGFWSCFSTKKKKGFFFFFLQKQFSSGGILQMAPNPLPRWGGGFFGLFGFCFKNVRGKIGFWEPPEGPLMF